MSESPNCVVSLSPNVSAGLIHAYDRTLTTDALAMDLPAPPLAAWFIRRGNVTVQCTRNKNTSVVAHENQWLFLPATPRKHQMAPGTHLLSVRMILERSPGLALFTVQEPFCISDRQIPSLASLAINLVKASPRDIGEGFCSNTGCPLNGRESLTAHIKWRKVFLSWVEAYIRLVLSQGWKMEREAPSSPIVEKTLSWIQRQGFSTPIQQSDIAGFSGLSLSHLKRVFQRELKLSPIDYWQGRRLEEARRLLRESSLSLKAISGDLGFRFPSHFSMWFRNRAGMSPLEFRNREIVGV